MSLCVISCKLNYLVATRCVDLVTVLLLICSKSSKKEVTLNEGVSNPVYDEKPMGDFAMGDLDTDMFTDDTFVVPAETKSGATSMANPLYQDPYMEDDDSPLSNF